MTITRCFAPVVFLLSATMGPTSSAQSNSKPGQVGEGMRVAMEHRTVIRVGTRAGDIIGADNRALQAAVDYVGGAGGGIVEIGPGEYLMRDSLHLRSDVEVRGSGDATILVKARAVSSALKLDGDYGEEQVTLASPEGFEVGDGVAVWDKNANGFHITVARIIGRSDDTFAIDLPLNADCLVENGARAATVYPVVSGYHLKNVRLSGLTIEGNKGENPALNGCRGGGIFLYRCPGAIIERCTVKNYSGDGISFQQSNDAQVMDSVCEGNAGLGLHPGSGSQRPTIKGCVARRNGEDGLFLCWRVKFGLFEDNVLEDNGRFGISIGHKDTDNLLRRNQVRGNAEAGIFFRNETEGMAGSRNRLEANLIENNGLHRDTAGIRVRGETRDLVFKDNTIRDTRDERLRKQTVGVALESKTGAVLMEGNRIEAATPVRDDRERKP
jgi:hypothetical protein